MKGVTKKLTWFTPCPDLEPGEYLIASAFPFKYTYDVGYFHGVQPGGALKWTLADVTIDAADIVKVAAIPSPDEREENDEQA